MTAVDIGLLVGKPNTMGQEPTPATIKTSHRLSAGHPLRRGFQRLTGQRILLGEDGPRCTVFGTLHRRPVSEEVPLATAVDLARRGLSTVVRVEGA